MAGDGDRLSALSGVTSFLKGRRSSLPGAVVRAAPPAAAAPVDAPPDPPPPPVPPPPSTRSVSEPRLAKFAALLDAPRVDVDALRELAWSGVPPQLRGVVWRLLLGYLPADAEKRPATLARKRAEYAALVPAHHARAAAPGAPPDEAAALRQVSVDAPRTAPGAPLFARPDVQAALIRLLYIWGVRHPASGYVQGVNDLAVPLLAAFITDEAAAAAAAAGTPPPPPDAADPAWTDAVLPPDALAAAEADTYACLGRLLQGVQDHYTPGQPGIQRAVARAAAVVARVDAPLAAHLAAVGADYMQFAFRWANCLLAREVPPAAAARLFDTWIAEGARLADFLAYAAASFLVTWRDALVATDFQGVVLFLQRPPTAGWGAADVEPVLARAFMWRASFGGAPSHLA